MAVLRDPSVLGRFAFEFEDDERLNHEVTNVNVDTEDANLDSFLARVPEDVWCGVAEGILKEISDEVLTDIRRGSPRSRPDSEGLTPW